MGLVIGACKEATIPKPRGYFRIDFPEKNYKWTADKDLPYAFQIAQYAAIEPDTQIDAEAYWANVTMPLYNAQIHLSYKTIRGNLEEYIEDSHKLAYDHVIKADAIKALEYQNPSNQVYGVLYQLEGNTATSVQFMATDSTKHFLRGSLYLNEVPNKDSLGVVIEYLKEDVKHLMNTLTWKN